MSMDSIKAKLRKGLNYFLVTVVVIIVAAYLICGYGYGSGSQAGVLMKFSKKGLVFKTYEGELNTGGMGNIANTAQMNQIWNFSVTDPAIADSLINLSGRRVSLHYKQILKQMPWQGETNLFVDGFTVLPN